MSQRWRCRLTRESSSNIKSTPNAPSTSAEPPTIEREVTLHPAERAAQAAEREPGDEERQTEAERVHDEQRAAGPDAVLVRGDAEDRAEDRADARRPAEPERGARDRGRRDAEASELRMKSLLLVQPRRAQEQRSEQEQRHREHHRARDAREHALVVAEELPEARRRKPERDEHRAEPERRTTPSSRRCAACAHCEPSCNSARSRPVTIER